MERPYVLTTSFLIALAGCSALLWLRQDIFHSTLLESFMPHGYCFLWNGHLVTLHVASDAVIGFSYFLISGLLVLLVYKNRRLIPFKWMFLAFGIFIVACGITHLLSILVLWKPYYWLEGEVKLLTAAVSLSTACLLPTIMPHIRKLLVDAESTALAREQREHAHTFTRSIIESSTFAIFVTDDQGLITNINPAAERLLWCASEEVVNKANILSFLDPQELSAVADARSAEFDEDIASGFDTLTVRARRGLHDDGEWKMVRKDNAVVPGLTAPGLAPDSMEEGITGSSDGGITLFASPVVSAAG